MNKVEPTYDLLYHITNSMTVTVRDKTIYIYMYIHISDYDLTKDTPYLDLMGELRMTAFTGIQDPNAVITMPTNT